MTVLIRFSGDITTKSRVTYKRFMEQLVENLRDALSASGSKCSIERTRNRILVETSGTEALHAVSRVFGVQSISAVEERCAERLDVIVDTAGPLFRERVRDRRFAVRARRVGQKHDGSVSARDVERELGSTLLADARGVDLSHPDFTAYVEMCEGETFLFGERTPGPGGLPLGVEGRAVALVSGGFDSAVAAWNMLKRGVALDYVFCNLGGAAHEQGTLQVMKVIADNWSYGDQPILHSLDFAPIVKDLQDHAETAYWQVILKRLMLRAAERIARLRHASVLVTGEAIGQVSSQTLHNLAVISQATSVPILRPLVTYNKDAIIEEAKRIGTYDVSRVVGEYCAIVPRKPATHASKRVVQEEEAKLDDALIAAAVDQRKRFDLRALDADAIGAPELELKEIPRDAAVIDLRSKPEFDSWHYPDALRLDFSQALQAYPSFETKQHYVLYCEIGLKSAHLAELMQKAGLKAHHFKGGLRALRRYVEAGH